MLVACVMGGEACAGHVWTAPEPPEAVRRAARREPHAGYLFWTDRGDVYRASLDGENVLRVHAGSEGAGLASYVDVDPRDAKLYSYGCIGRPGESSGYVRRSNLDGSEPEEVLTGLPSPVHGFAVDPIGRAMYIGGRGDDPQTGLRRANLDGSGLTVLPPAPSDPPDIVVDRSGGAIYFSDLRDGGVKRFLPDDEDITALVGREEGDAAAVHLAVDPRKSALYYTRGNAGELVQVGLDGSEPAVLLSGLDGVRDVDCDQEAGGLYFATAAGIHRAGPGGMVGDALVRFDDQQTADGPAGALLRAGESLAVLSASGSGYSSAGAPSGSRDTGASSAPASNSPAAGPASPSSGAGGGAPGGPGSARPPGGFGTPPSLGGPTDPPLIGHPVDPPLVFVPPVVPQQPDAPPVPEPSTLALVGIGVCGVCGAALRRRKLARDPISDP